jgi:YD repeat-containing protein
VDFHNYDNLYRLTTEAKKWAGSGTTAYRYGYQYDAAGNRTQLAYYNGSTTATSTYGYSDFNQLTTRTAYGYTIPYQYDDNGSRSFNGLYPYLYYFAHDRADRLTTHTAGPNATLQASYVYDAAARRILRTDASGNKLKFYFDGLSPVLVKEKPVGSSTWRTKKVYALKPAGIGQIIAERENTAWNAQGQPTAWTAKIYSYDLLGNVVAVTD